MLSLCRGRPHAEDAPETAGTAHLCGRGAQAPLLHRLRRQDVRPQDPHEAKRQLPGLTDLQRELSSREVHHNRRPLLEEGVDRAHLRPVDDKEEAVADRREQAAVEHLMGWPIILINYSLLSTMITEV